MSSLDTEQTNLNQADGNLACRCENRLHLLPSLPWLRSSSCSVLPQLLSLPWAPTTLRSGGWWGGGRRGRERGSEDRERGGKTEREPVSLPLKLLNQSIRKVVRRFAESANIVIRNYFCVLHPSVLFSVLFSVLVQSFKKCVVLYCANAQYNSITEQICYHCSIQLGDPDSKDMGGYDKRIEHERLLQARNIVSCEVVGCTSIQSIWEIRITNKRVWGSNYKREILIARNFTSCKLLGGTCMRC